MAAKQVKYGALWNKYNLTGIFFVVGLIELPNSEDEYYKLLIGFTFLGLILDFGSFFRNEAKLASFTAKNIGSVPSKSVAAGKLSRYLLLKEIIRRFFSPIYYSPPHEDEHIKGVHWRKIISLYKFTLLCVIILIVNFLTFPYIKLEEFSFRLGRLQSEFIKFWHYVLIIGYGFDFFRHLTKNYNTSHISNKVPRIIRKWFIKSVRNKNIIGFIYIVVRPAIECIVVLWEFVIAKSSWK